MSDLPLRYCTCCTKEVRDDGKGTLRQSGDKGGQRWNCPSCSAKVRKAQGQKKLRAGRATGAKPGRPSKSPQFHESYSAEALSDVLDDLRIIRQDLGL